MAELDRNRVFEILNRNPYSAGAELEVGYGENKMAPTDLAAIITSSVPIVGDVLGLAADADMYFRDPQSRTLLNYLLSAAGMVPLVPAASQVKKGIKAYHGSPHDFDEFSTDAIGTGEGAQAYGRGLYFAESEDVARDYRDRLTPRDLDYEEEVMRRYKEAEQAGDYGRMEMYENAMMHESPNEIRDRYSDYDEDYQELAEEVAQELESLNPQMGRLYEVELNVSPDELLDYDAPLREQSDIVKKGLVKIKSGGDPLVEELIGINDRDPDPNLLGVFTDSKGGQIINTLRHDNFVVPADRKITALNEKMAELSKVMDEDNIRGMYQEYKTDRGRKASEEYNRLMDERSQVVKQRQDAEKNLIEEAKKYGIKGIKYKDGFSRNNAGNTSNYVIFDDRLITISKKYGIAIPAAAALIARQTGQDPEDLYEEA